MKLRHSVLTALGAALLLQGCVLGPDYQRPAVEIPAVYRHGEAWKEAGPAEAEPGEAWWTRYGDPVLDELLPQAAGNQDIAAAEARYRQALAVAAGLAADALPTVDSVLSAGRGRIATDGSGSRIAASSRLEFGAAWEADLWGRLRRRTEAGTLLAEAGAADLAAARLATQLAIVRNYLRLRVNDAHQRLLARSIAAYQRSLEITRNRHGAGVASQADVAQAETQLRSAQAQAVELGLERARLEHAIAVLLGRPPAAFRIAAAEGVPTLPEIPLQAPSTLLERRPDVAAAERRVAADNARIGIARAAWFPVLTLGAGAGFQDSSLAGLLALPHRMWSVGPALALTLFDGGTRRAADDEALAAYDLSVAHYRQTVLNAFREVEDSLASLRILAEESAVQDAAVQAANDFLALTNNQYLAGTVSYLNVAIAQAAALAAERARLDLLDRRLAASVDLVGALGGPPWQSAVPAALADARR